MTARDAQKIALLDQAEALVGELEDHLHEIEKMIAERQAHDSSQ